VAVDLEKQAELAVEESNQFCVIVSLSLRKLEACLHPSVRVLSCLLVMGEQDCAWAETLGCIGPELLETAKDLAILFLKVQLLDQLLKFAQNSIERLLTGLVTLQRRQSRSILDLKSVSKETLEREVDRV